MTDLDCFQIRRLSNFSGTHPSSPLQTDMGVFDTECSSPASAENDNISAIFEALKKRLDRRSNGKISRIESVAEKTAAQVKDSASELIQKQEREMRQKIEEYEAEMEDLFTERNSIANKIKGEMDSFQVQHERLMGDLKASTNALKQEETQYIREIGSFFEAVRKIANHLPIEEDPQGASASRSKVIASTSSGSGSGKKRGGSGATPTKSKNGMSKIEAIYKDIFDI
ncbi:hypothetical protein BJ742DRAFT_821312 [Cladochytrium replicatum]|nr:hypothetical protein BJ742DRAFT_821312 [Cladochytrium replicatum]